MFLSGFYTSVPEHREPEHFISNKNKCTVIYLCPCVFFESFRRDLNEAKRAVHISEYYLICRFVITTLRLRLKFQLTTLTINSHRERHSQVSQRPCVNREKRQGVKLDKSFRLVCDYSWVDQPTWFLAWICARKHETMDGGLWLQFSCKYFNSSTRQFQRCEPTTSILCMLVPAFLPLARCFAI